MGSRPRDRVLKKKKKKSVFFYKWPKKVILAFFGTKACNPFNPKMPKKGPFIWPFLAFFGLFRLFWAFFWPLCLFLAFMSFLAFFLLFWPEPGCRRHPGEACKMAKKRPFYLAFFGFFGLFRLFWAFFLAFVFFGLFCQKRPKKAKKAKKLKKRPKSQQKNAALVAAGSEPQLWWLQQLQCSCGSCSCESCICSSS